MLESLSFRFFSRFLSTFKKKAKKRTHECGDIVVDTDNETMIRLSPSSYDGACSALSHLFHECGIEKDATETTKDLWTKLSSFKKVT